MIMGIIEYRVIDKNIYERYGNLKDSVYFCSDKKEAEEKAYQLNNIIGYEKFIVIDRWY